MNNGKSFEPEYSLKVRIIITLAISLALIGGFIFLRMNDPYSDVERGYPMTCEIREATGFYCPTCGFTRAMYDLTRLDFLNALRNHGFLVIFFLPLIFYLSLSHYIHFMSGKYILPPLKINKWIVISLLVLLLVYTVIRNLPNPPFSYLAPLGYD